MAEALGLEEAIKNSDVILTGEGRYDTQTKHGKTVSEVRASPSRDLLHPNSPIVITQYTGSEACSEA